MKTAGLSDESRRCWLLSMPHVVIVIDLMVSVGVELANATGDEEYDCYTAEPPCDGDACREARHNQQNRTYDVADDG